MKASVFQLRNSSWVTKESQFPADANMANLVLCFGEKSILATGDTFQKVKNRFPNATIAMCSTAGEIFQDAVLDNSLVAAAIQFENTKVKAVSVNAKDWPDSYAAGNALIDKLPGQDLAYVLLLSDGSLVNGSELVKGLTSQIDKKVLITGGLAGDGDSFKSTLVGLNGEPEEGLIIAIGLYGTNIAITHGSQGGWDIFGLEKNVTGSNANVLFEIDGQNALDLYKKYLGPEANNLPGSALLFPLSVVIPGTNKPVVRTILSINEEEKSMTFAGDIPVGSKVRFMKANFDKLTMAASEAAKLTSSAYKDDPVFSLLISCVGRKLILGDRTSEEVKAVSKTFNDNTVLAGFYSYGEISPFNEGGNCQLHNQTMTITSFYETNT